jgi:hypothetical protein
MVMVRKMPRVVTILVMLVAGVLLQLVMRLLLLLLLLQLMPGVVAANGTKTLL